MDDEDTLPEGERDTVPMIRPAEETPPPQAEMH